MTTSDWVAELAAVVAVDGAIVRIVVAESDGSVPREAGAWMLVGRERTIGTIGGGTLEFEAIARARQLLTEPDPWTRALWTFPLGPALGQCCGGRVTLLAEVFGSAELGALEHSPSETGGLVVRPAAGGMPPARVSDRKQMGSWPPRVRRVVQDMLSGGRPRTTVLVRAGDGDASWLVEPADEARTPVAIYGAGHVGRALVRVLDGLPFTVTWVDVDEARFPAEASSAGRLATRDPAAAAAEMVPGTIHLVMTFSHPLDLAICHAVLAAGRFAYLGVIGSATKRARFLRRLSELGHSPAALDRLQCPIGLDGLGGKEPAVIAVSVAADLLRRRNALAEFADERQRA
jgi:xanthine dehydrogenase accessory factor